MTDFEKALEAEALAYSKSVGDDCLCSRTQPGTPVGECIYIFCGCYVHEAYVAGYKAALAKLETKGTR